jgi:hypothetical protein
MSPVVTHSNFSMLVSVSTLSEESGLELAGLNDRFPRRFGAGPIRALHQ